jgi:hypothetical protein
MRICKNASKFIRRRRAMQGRREAAILRYKQKAQREDISLAVLSQAPNSEVSEEAAAQTDSAPLHSPSRGHLEGSAAASADFSGPADAQEAAMLHPSQNAGELGEYSAEAERRRSSAAFTAVAL